MKPSKLIILMGALVLLTACASPPLKAPCPNFGKYCSKIPINSWNTQTA